MDGEEGDRREDAHPIARVTCSKLQRRPFEIFSWMEDRFVASDHSLISVLV